jgi:hypothetical protein
MGIQKAGHLPPAVVAFWWRESDVMGDDELNFTDQEADCWADDPRNQAPTAATRLGILIACILILVAIVTIVAASNSGESRSDVGDTQIGMLLVL